MERFRQAQAEVVRWAHSRGVFHHGTPYTQFKKTFDEVMALGLAIQTSSVEDVADAIGEAIVALIIQAEMDNIDPLEAIENVLEIIKEVQDKEK